MQTHDNNVRPSVREHFTDNELYLLHQYHAGQSTQASDFPALPAGDPVDWPLFFHVVVRVLVIAAAFFIAYRVFCYFQLFGASAVALSGQVAIALFFTYAVLTGYDDAETLVSCVGMFLLVGMF